MSARARLALDAGLLLTFLVAFNPALTGISVHEWLSLAVIVPTLVHLVVNTDWVMHTAKRIVAKLREVSALNLAVDAALFVATVTVMLSGFMVSQVIASALGVTAVPSVTWHVVHSASATATIVLLLAHFALHLPWAIRVLKRTLTEQPLEG